jgi:hypothetical protein
MEGHDDDGTANGTMYRQEDPKCRAWCHKDRCRCLSECEP